MGDNSANLRNYQIQLQQVEAALLSDPDNAELVKLKDDLLVRPFMIPNTSLICFSSQEVIALTKQLMASEGEADPSGGPIMDDFSHNFEAGDLVLAPFSEDGQ